MEPPAVLPMSPDVQGALPPRLLPHLLCRLPQGAEYRGETLLSHLRVGVQCSSRPTTLVTSRPPCRKVTSLRDGHSTPPTDSLLRFLVESSCDDYPTCANCDRNEKTPMFFCNTCGKVFLLFNKKRGCCVFAPPSLNKFLCNISGNKLFSVK